MASTLCKMGLHKWTYMWKTINRGIRICSRPDCQIIQEWVQ